MSIFIRVIAVTAICGIGLISKLNSIHIITAYEEYVEKSFNNNFTEICQPANRMVGVIVSISHWANGKMVITYQKNQICTQSHDPKNCSQSGDRLLKVLQKQITYQSVTNATVNIAYPEPNHEGLTLSYLLLKVYQESNISRIHLVDGGAGQQKVSIDVFANNTKYLQYNATLYGM